MYETEKEIMNIDNLISLFDSLSKYELDCIYFHNYFNLTPFEEVREEVQVQYKNIYEELGFLKGLGIKNIIYEEEMEHETLSFGLVNVDILNCFNNKNWKPVNIYLEN